MTEDIPATGDAVISDTTSQPTAAPLSYVPQTGDPFSLETVSYTHLDVYKRQEYLYDMGFGPFLGCTPVDRVEEPCVEEITCREFGGEWTGTLICTDWDAVRRSGEWITRFVPVPGAVEICRLLDEEKRYLAPSMLLLSLIHICLCQLD